MRPVPAARSHGPHHPSLGDCLRAAGYELHPSQYPGKRLLTHRGQPVGHYSAYEAGREFSSATSAALDAIRRGIDAA